MGGPESMEQRNLRLRWLVVWVVAAVWMVAVLARLSYLQLFDYSDIPRQGAAPAAAHL